MTGPAQARDLAADLQRYDCATAHLEPPFAVVDLAALRANATAMTRRAAGKPIRLASKSVRCRELTAQVLATSGFRGILAYTLPEALWLAGQGACDDIVVGYPTADRAALARLAGDPAAAATVTRHGGLRRAPRHDREGRRHRCRARIRCVSASTSTPATWRCAGAAARAPAARRSGPRLRPAELAAAIVSRPGLRLAGLMAYEAQIAGVGDNPAGRPAYAMAVR